MRSKKALLMLAAMFLLLTGCGAPLLSERAVVRAVCFRGAAQAARVSLVLEAAGQEDTFQTVTGRGASYAAALKDAERQLDGAVFYGLMDLALLPPQAGWEQAAEIGQLLADTALPAPRIDVFLLSAQTVSEKADALYAEIRTARKKYGVSNGLQQLFARENECALPVWQSTEFGFGVLRQGRAATVWTEPLTAQLAAVLCGQADRFDCVLPGQDFSLACKAGVYRQAGAGGVCLQLTLRDAQIDALGANEDGQAAVERALQHAFAEICTQTDTAESGLLQLQAWQFAEDGRTKPPSVRLMIQTEQG